MSVDIANVPGLDWSDDGCAALSGEALAKASWLDEQFCKWAACLGAVAHRFPSIIPAASLAPIGYLGSFPHLATFVTSGNRDRLKDIAVDHGDCTSLPANEGLLDAATHLLTPATCYHFYPRMQGETLDEPRLLTARCQCHRREEKYLPLQRQWSFQMREIVCVGDDASVEAFIDACLPMIDAFAESLGLDVSWNIATDPFFDPATDSKALAQMLEPVKQELCTPNGLAIASVNRHRSFFGESYDIRAGDEPARSACVAFGIERWLYALLEQGS
jgi:hypothetical protein